MAFTWQKLKEKYDKMHVSKPNHIKKFYEDCFLIFERVVRDHLPGGFENPKIVSKNYYLLSDKFGNYEFPRKYLFSIRAILSILNAAYTRNYNPSKAHADRKTFSEYETRACLSKWFENHGWEVIRSYYDKLSLKRKKEVLVFELLGSERKNKTNSSFFQVAGHCMVNLLEEKHSNRTIIPALAFPDDQPTLNALLPLKKYFNKLGIKLYAVKSADHVTQL